MKLFYLSVLNVILGITLQFVFIYVTSDHNQTDSYFISQTIPFLVLAILGGAVSNNITPMLTRVAPNKRAAVAGSAAMVIFLLSIIIFGLISFSTPLWISLFFGGLSQDSLELTKKLIPLFSLIAVFQMVTTVTVASYHSEGKFVYIEIIQLFFSSILLVFSVIVIKKFGVEGFVWLNVIRSGFIMIFTGYNFFTINSIKLDEFNYELWIKTRKLLSASVIFKFGPLVDRTIASYASVGTITSLGIGQQIVNAIVGITDKTLSKPLLVDAGNHLKAKKKHELLLIYKAKIFTFNRCLFIFFAFLPLFCYLMNKNYQYNFIDLHFLGNSNMAFLFVITAIPSVMGQMSSSLVYAIGDITSINRIALTSFLISNSFKVIGFFYIDAYAIIIGVFLYHFLNWIGLHIVATKNLSSEKFND